jgi:subfamily B ATP-binding cassette protein HlyB/CyaB
VHGKPSEEQPSIAKAARQSTQNQFSSESSDNISADLQCLVLAARLHGVAIPGAQASHAFALAGDNLTAEDLCRVAKHYGLKAKVLRTDASRLGAMALPLILRLNTGRRVVLAALNSTGEPARALLQDPTEANPQVMTVAELASLMTGEVIALTARATVSDAMRRFDFTWFVPSIVKYRHLLGEVLVASLFVQLFALITPLMFQVVMDKVLVHQGFSTLAVVCTGLVGVAVFGFVLSALRTYTFSHTASRIDAELGAKVFAHLMALPQAYFEVRRAGDSIARVRELENIRQFLTGNAVTVVLDLLFSTIFIVVMFYYSVTLTLIVLISLPVYIALSVSVTPVLRTRLEEKFRRGADNQAFLVEAVSAIHTVKAGALEPQLRKRWDEQLAGYVNAGFQVTKVSTWAGEAVQLINKLTTVAVLFFGAHLVIKGDLTVGQFVAFNMLAGQVAAPIMRLAQLWQDFQQAGLAMRRLADILEMPTERASDSSTTLPRLNGEIRFEDVRFRYRPDGLDVLQDISLEIRAGEVIGIVGRSGSGKSTLTKLLQRLYVPQAGRITVDGMDIIGVDPASLRRQIGVVLQENRLFASSIRDNIAVADPGMPIERVIAAAKLAGAHEFIGELPQGYHTEVGEQGFSLSGGQRQRIALARALVTNPRILILDEATSALDVESERIIQSNMHAIAKGRTVIIIAHRLSAVRDAHRIIVMDQGRIVESGAHSELIRKPHGRYAALHALQVV